jgi:tRNA-Thr(GGU) m(6)t(6)A37 methyltransferase TsaA
MKQIKIKPIGIIHSPYKDVKDVPIQGTFRKDVKGRIKLFRKYRAGLKDIEGFSHLILIYYFHRAREEKLIAKPYLDDETHGIFAIRSPMRPNHIGISIVKLEKVEKNIVVFSEVDVIDKTPLLDIKPYVSYYDTRKNVKNGWIDKHFAGGRMPERLKQLVKPKRRKNEGK